MSGPAERAELVPPEVRLSMVLLNRGRGPAAFSRAFPVLKTAGPGSKGGVPKSLKELLRGLLLSLPHLATVGDDVMVVALSIFTY